MYREGPSQSPLVLAVVDGTVTAYIRLTGKEAWTFRVPDGATEYRLFTRIACTDERAILVAARLDENGFFASANVTAHVCCLELASGSLLWHQRIETGQNIAFFNATLLVDGEQVFLAQGASLMAFVLASGQLLWHQPVQGATLQTNTVPIALAVPGQAVQGDAR